MADKEGQGLKGQNTNPPEHEHVILAIKCGIGVNEARFHYRKLNIRSVNISMVLICPYCNERSHYSILRNCELDGRMQFEKLRGAFDKMMAPLTLPLATEQDCAACARLKPLCFLIIVIRFPATEETHYVYGVMEYREWT